VRTFFGQEGVSNFRDFVRGIFYERSLTSSYYAFKSSIILTKPSSELIVYDTSNRNYNLKKMDKVPYSVVELGVQPHPLTNFCW